MKAIIVIGAMGAGKSTVLAIAQSHDVQVVSIDGCREEVNAYLPYLEVSAWQLLEDAMLRADQIIVECSGTSKFFESLVCRYPGELWIVKLTCSLEEIKHRIRKRFRYGYKWPPVSWKADHFKVAERQYYSLQNRKADLVIDTELCSPDQAAQLIIELLKKPY